MKFNYKKLLLVLVVISVSATSCFDDLNVVPLDEEVLLSENVYKDPAAYKQVLAKIYAGLAVSGQEGPAGQPDISGIDEGFSTYLRQYWKAQELSTDEAVIAWNDGNIHDYHEQDWDANNEFVTAMYYRIFFQVTLINEFLRETTSDKLNDRGVSTAQQAEIATFRAEARFMRALSYWHGLDMFRNIPFIVEEDGIGSFFPAQTNAADLFAYIESELTEIEALLPAARQNEYGRADQGAAAMLLAKLYLNAEVYIGTPKYDECITACNKVINGGYSLEGEYAHLFLADNHNSSEVIFPINFDGISTRTWGGMTFLVHAAVGGSMSPADFGIDNGWGGSRTTPALVNKFDTSATNMDSRKMFHSDGQAFEIDMISDFTQGWAVTKYKNLNADGSAGSDITFPDTDFPMFRLGDAYLMYAEAVLRGGSGDAAIALGYVNDIRARANESAITAADLDLDFILDERARELYWECHRRTDLIRFGKFTSGYTWDWKGGVKEGQDVDEKYNIFPIPSADLGANPTLNQNDGY